VPTGEWVSESHLGILPTANQIACRYVENLSVAEQPGATAVLVGTDTVLLFDEVQYDGLETCAISVLDENLDRLCMRLDTLFDFRKECRPYVFIVRDRGADIPYQFFACHCRMLLSPLLGVLRIVVNVTKHRETAQSYEHAQRPEICSEK
jgi:hypothetical protein